MGFEQFPIQDEDKEEIKKEKSFLDKAKYSLKKTVALGAAIGAGYFGGEALAENAPQVEDKDKTEHTAKVEHEKIDSKFINSFVEKIKEDAKTVAQSDDDRVYKMFVKQVEDFITKVTFENFSEDGKKAMHDAGIEIGSVLSKVQIRMESVKSDLKEKIDGLSKTKGGGKAYGVDLAEARKMTINQHERDILSLESLKVKIDRLKAQLEKM